MESTGNDAKFLTLEEAASMLQVSKRTLHRLLQRRKMPGLKIGGQWRIPASPFMKWIEDRMTPDPETPYLTREK